MNLKEIITAKNSGFRTKKVEVPEWGVTVSVREPLHINLNRYIKSIRDISENDKLTEREKDIQNIKSEAVLFASVLIDDNGNLLLNDGNLEDLIKSYGPIHTRVLDQSIALTGLLNKPLEEAEKK